MIRYPVASSAPTRVNGRLGACAMCVCTLLLVHSPLAAQITSERTLAEALFRQARELMSEGRYAEACPKFAESQRLDPGGGTLLNLAVCHQSQGKLASAWAEFQDALAQAKSDGRHDRVALAQERIDQLEPKLARLTIVVQDPPNAELVVTVNGTPLGAAGWGIEIPVDAGAITVTASATGHESYSRTVQIRDSHKVLVEVPALSEATTPSSGASEIAGTSPTVEASYTSAYITGGIGLAAIGLGSYFGVRALQEHRVAERGCDDECTADGRRADENAVFNGWLSTIGFGAGLSLMGIAAYLYALEDDTSLPLPSTGRGQPFDRTHVTLTPKVGRQSAAVELSFNY